MCNGTVGKLIVSKSIEHYKPLQKAKQKLQTRRRQQQDEIVYPGKLEEPAGYGFKVINQVK